MVKMLLSVVLAHLPVSIAQRRVLVHQGGQDRERKGSRHSILQAINGAEGGDEQVIRHVFH